LRVNACKIPVVSHRKQSSVSEEPAMLRIFICSALFLVALSAPALAVETLSPDAALSVEVATGGNRHLSYSVRRSGVEIIGKSNLGVMLDGVDVGRDVAIGQVARSSHDESYPWRGVKSVAANSYNESRIAIAQGASGYTLELRVFNDGLAFRYVFARGGTVSGESTAFAFPPSSTVWYQDNVRWYEGVYHSRRAASIPAGTVCGVPFTVQLPGQLGYAAVTEGALINYSGMSLRSSGRGCFQAHFACDTKWTPQGPVVTPWRIVLIGPDLNTLVNSDIVHNVAPAPDARLFPQGSLTPWIKPGRCVWSWLCGGGIDVPSMEEFAALGHELGFEYNLIDEGWEQWQPWGEFGELQQVVDFSKQHSIDTWVWKAAPDRNGIPGLFDQAARQEFFRRVSEMGVAGVKIDFLDDESFATINFIQQTLADAAEFHLLVDFHGAPKPTGESRTWPNELTREGIRGLENLDGGLEAGTLQCTHPFVRYLAGPADFTPLHFYHGQQQISWAHQLASAVIYTSPLLVFSEHPRLMLDNPSAGIIKAIPSCWDETRVLPPSEIGRLVAFARRSGDEWFLAVMNGDSDGDVTLSLPLAFLGPGAYTMDYCRDDLAPQLTYASGIGTHAPAEITYNLGGAYTRFTCLAGIDGETGSRGSATFEVYADDRLVYASGLVHGAAAPQAIDADITGAKLLRLVTGDGGDGKNYDHTDWADARLIDKRGRVVELSSKAWVSASAGYGKTHKNASIVGAPLRFTGRTGAAGAGTAGAADELKITMSPGGGYIAHFMPAEKQAGQPGAGGE
jgi:alpha-glucosidase